MIKNSLIFVFLFTVRVNVPWGDKQTFVHVRHVTPVYNGSYELVLEDGKHTWVPAAFTIVVEE